MNKLFKRNILERIDYFNYLDPDSLKTTAEDEKDKSEQSALEKDEDDDKDESKKDKKKNKAEEDRRSKPFFKNERNARDLRRYMQYSNVKND